MHNPDYIPAATINASTSTAATPFGGHHIAPENVSVVRDSNNLLYKQPIDVRFCDQQIPPNEQKLSKLIAEKIARKEFFYGIEIAAHTFGHPTLLDYNSFGAVMPLFTSLIWLGQDYWNIDGIANVDSISFATKLQPRTVVMPHFTCYRANTKRLEDFLALNFSNVLALRGDVVESEQDYKHASELVKEIRRIRGDTISIAVAGYPEGHPDAISLEEDMKYLIEKINAGADFIITQICFSSEAVIDFIKKCRSHGVRVPILVGVFIPQNMRILRRIMQIARVQMPAAEFDKYLDLSDTHEEFRDYAVQKAIEMITEVFDSDLGVYGVQFFSTNRFKNIQLALAEIITKKNFENIIRT